MSFKFVNSSFNVYDIRYISLERKCTREEPSVGGKVKNKMGHRLHNVTAYAWVFSGSFSLQEDIKCGISLQLYTSTFKFYPLVEKSRPTVTACRR